MKKTSMYSKYNTLSRDVTTVKLECSFFQNHLKGKQDIFNELTTKILSLH